MTAGKVLYVKLATQLGDLQSGLARGAGMITAYGAKVDRTMQSLEKYAQKNQRELQSLGNAAGLVGLAAAAGVGLAITKFAAFDKQMSAVQAATHATGAEMAALRTEAINLGADTQFSAVEAAQGIEELAKAGVSTADILGGALKGSLDLAAAGALGVGDAAEIAATAMTQFGLKGRDLPHVADLLAAGAGKAQGSVTDLGAALGQTGLVAAGMGLSIEDTTGTLAAFASAGMTGSDAGTSFKTMIQRLQAPMGRGAEAMKQYGISAYDAQGNFIGITEVAGQLQQKLKGLTQQQRDAALTAIFGADAIRGATVLYKQGAGGIQEWIDKTNEAGYASETARLRTDNLAGDIERLGGSLDSLFIGMGAGANGPAREFVQMLEGGVDILNAVPGPVKSTAVAVAALTAAFGLSVFAATRMMGALSGTRAGMMQLQVAAWRSAAAVTAMNKATLLTNIGKGTAVLAGLTLASSDLGKKFELTNTAAFALMGAMGGPLGVAAGAASGFLLDVASASTDAEQAFQGAAEALDNASTFSQQAKALEKYEKAYAKTMDTLGDGGYWGEFANNFKVGFKELTGQEQFWEQQEKDVKAARAEIEKYQTNIQMLEDVTQGAGDGINEMFDPRAMQRFADTAGPILEKYGLDLQKIMKEGPEGKQWDRAVAALKAYKAETDGVEGRSQAVEDAVSGVGDELLTAAAGADELADALNGLFSPEMNYDDAMAKWRQGLRDLKTELGNGAKVLDTSIEGDKNTAAVRSTIRDLTASLKAAAEAGETSGQLAQKMQAGRQAIVDAGVAAWFTAEQMNGLLDKYNLTPELVRTLIEAQGAPQAKAEIESVYRSADSVDRLKPSVTVTDNGTPGQVGRNFQGLGGVIRDLNGKDARVTSSDGGSSGTVKRAIDAVGGALKAIDGKKATVTTTKKTIIQTVFETIGKAVKGAKGSASARGGLFLPGGIREFAYGDIIYPGPGGGVRAMARGGDTNQAHIASAGIPIHRYAEPETLGEAYIPFARDRRARATKILGKTAARFGYDLLPRGMEAAGARIVVVNNGAQAPLVGSVTFGGGSRAEQQQQMVGFDYELRKLRRGGRYNG